MIRYTSRDKTIIIDGVKSYEFKPVKKEVLKEHYFIYEVKPKDRLDTLSNYYYSNPLYGYVIASINPGIDVFELEEGYKLKVIYPEYLRYYA